MKNLSKTISKEYNFINKPPNNKFIILFIAIIVYIYYKKNN